jgi:rhomboid family protein
MPASNAAGQAIKCGCRTRRLLRLVSGSRVRTYIFPVFLVQIPAWVFLGLWFLYQLIEANFGLFSASANGGGVAFFAHVGGFVFGLLAARLLSGAGRVVHQTQ